MLRITGARGLCAGREYVHRPSGLCWLDIELGRGTALSTGDVVQVHYTGRLHANGMKLDSSHDRGKPISFTLGASRMKGSMNWKCPPLLRGWDEGIAGMRVGGKRELLIPPELAHGDRRCGPIPAGATLAYVCELVDAQPPPKSWFASLLG